MQTLISDRTPPSCLHLGILMATEGQGMGLVNQAGQKTSFAVFVEDFAGLSRAASTGATVSDCAAARNPFIGEQFVDTSA
jgi:hypothetical protein